MNVKTLCLGILHLGEASGYEIRKLTQEGRFSHFVDASYGAIYPALAALEREGLVSGREERHAGRPDRRVYSITEAGRTALVAELEAGPRDDVIKSELLFVLRFAELVTPTHVSREIDRRIDWLDGQIANLEEAVATKSRPTSQFACGYGLAVYRAMRDFLRDNRALVEEVAGTGLIGDQAAE